MSRVRPGVLVVVTALALAGGAATPRGPADPAARVASGTRVLAISVDGLNPVAVRRLGPARAPVLHRLLAEGAGTLNARASRELTLTLPNHTSMVTGRPIARAQGGHGVTWNGERRRTSVHRAAGRRVSSVFSVVARGGGGSTVLAGKEKFELFRRSWPGGVDRSVVDPDPAVLVREARIELLRGEHELVLLHLAVPDTVGHATGFMSRRYLDAVARTDRFLGRVLRTVDRNLAIADELTLVLTADHGGRGRDHAARTRLANVRVPFVAWGAGVAAGDLYALNPQRRDPGRGRPSYAVRRPPIRNGDLANVVTALLGLPPVPGSLFGAGQDLALTSPGSPAAG